MNVHRIMVVVAAFVALGILTVWQHVELIQIGRKVRELERDKTKLEQEYGKLELKVRGMKSPENLLKRAKELGLDVGQSGAQPAIQPQQVQPARPAAPGGRN